MLVTYLPFHIFGAQREGRWLITCDHAANTIPPSVPGGSLGLDEKDMQRHIAFDIGAAGVARALGERLNSPVICSNFSRLVIDPNRGADDPTLLMKLYDGTIIPGNRTAGADVLDARLNECYRPYHSALADLAAQKEDVVIVSVHSFTPKLKGKPARPWEIGVLSAHDRRLADPLLNSLRTDKDLTIGDNEPYDGHLPGDAIDQHALQHERLNVLIEIRNDLIETPDGQMAWAERLTPHLEDALENAQI